MKKILKTNEVESSIVLIKKLLVPHTDYKMNNTH